MPKPSASGYRPSSWSRYNGALKQRGSLSVWFDRDLDGCAARKGKRGHPETFSDQAIQACLTLKGLFGLPLRQTVGLLASLIKDGWPRLASAGVVHTVPPSGQDFRSKA